MRPYTLYVAVRGESGSETGFARYRPTDIEAWFVSVQRSIVVEDFFPPHTAAYLGLLRFSLGPTSLIVWCFGCCRLTIRCHDCCEIAVP